MSKISIIGYHGTEINYVNRILQDGFTSNQRDDHWLGQGFYFYKEFTLAKWWAEKKFKAQQEEPAVIKVEILIDESELLNLDSVDGINTFFRELKKILQPTEVRVNFKNKERIMNFCFALDLLKEELGLLVVIRSFLRKSPTYGEQNIGEFEKKFFNLPHDFAYLEMQICVSKNECIKNKTMCHPIRRTTWS